MEKTIAEIYLMNPETGSVDTVEGWISDMESTAPDYEGWGDSREEAIEQINGLCEVRKTEDGTWEEVPFPETQWKGYSDAK